MVSRRVIKTPPSPIPRIAYDNIKSVTPQLCYSKSPKYDKAPNMVSFYPQCLQANAFAGLFTCPLCRTNSSSLPRYTKKHLLKCIFSENLIHIQPNLKVPYNQDIKVQVNTKDNFYKKSPTPKAHCAGGCFPSSTLYLCCLLSKKCIMVRINTRETEQNTNLETF